MTLTISIAWLRKFLIALDARAQRLAQNGKRLFWFVTLVLLMGLVASVGEHLLDKDPDSILLNVLQLAATLITWFFQILMLLALNYRFKIIDALSEPRILFLLSIAATAGHYALLYKAVAWANIAVHVVYVVAALAVTVYLGETIRQQNQAEK